MEMKNDVVLNKFIETVKNHFKDRQNKILLFGSRARGDFSPESDYDCILLLDAFSAKDEEFIDKLETQILLEDNVLFSIFLMSEKDFKIKKYEPFLMNARKEGIFV